MTPTLLHFKTIATIIAWRTTTDAFLLRSGLTNLLLQPLARIPHTLILVGVGRTQRAHFRRHLAYLLTVDSGQRDLRLLRIDRSLHARGQRIFDGMRIAQTKHHHSFALHLGAIADADNLQVARPTPSHTLDGII